VQGLELALEARGDRIARPRQIDLDDRFDAPRPGAEYDDAVGQGDRLTPDRG